MDNPCDSHLLNKKLTEDDLGQIANSEISNNMQSKLTVFLSLAVLAVVPCVTAKVIETSLSGCPELQPEYNVGFDRLLGMWYLVQTTSSSYSCVTYNITKNDQGKYQVTITELHDSFFSALSYQHSTTVDLTLSNETPGVVNVHIPYSVRTTTLTILITDYENYLGIYVCKPTPIVNLVHSWTAEILSRTPTLSLDKVDKVRTRLLSNNIDTSPLQKVRQVGCPEPGAQNLLVKAGQNIASSVKTEVQGLYHEIVDKPTTPPVNEI